MNVQRFLVVLVLLVCTAAAYTPVAQFGYVNYDDDLYVPNNPHVRLGLSWSNVKWAFTTNYDGNWQPITWLSHMADVSLFGTSPGAHHVSNVAVHLANVVMLLIALLCLTGRFWPSLLVAAFFALHPLQVESVAWIAERKNLLSTFFGLFSIFLYGRYAKRGGGPLRYTAVWACLALGLMSKPMLVTFPFVYLLLDTWPLGRARLGEKRALHRVLRLVVEKIPFLCLSLASSAITYWVQRSAGAVQSFDALPLSVRVSNAALSYLSYLGKLFWPLNLAIPYSYVGDTLSAFQVFLAALTLGTITVLGIVWRKRKPQLLLGWLWYLGTLVPVIGLIQVGTQGMADRYTYVPFIGIFIAVAWSIPWLERRAGRVAIVGAVCAVLIMWAAVSRHQSSYWVDSRTLFEHTLQVVPNSAVAHYNLGNHYLDEADLERAEFHFTQAIQSLPEMHEAWHNLSLVWLRQKKYAQATLGFTELLAKSPNHVEARYNLSLAYKASGELESARDHLERVLQLDPAHAGAHYTLGSIHLTAGNLEEGLDDLREAAKLEPTDLRTLVTLGSALAKMGRDVEAQEYLRRALSLDPSNTAARYNLGLLFLNNGDLSAAEKQFRAIAEENRGDGANLYQLGRVLSMQGNDAEAIEVLTRAVSVAPTLAEPRVLLDRLLSTSDKR